MAMFVKNFFEITCSPMIRFSAGKRFGAHAKHGKKWDEEQRNIFYSTMTGTTQAYNALLAGKGGGRIGHELVPDQCRIRFNMHRSWIRRQMITVEFTGTPAWIMYSRLRTNDANAGESYLRMQLRDTFKTKAMGAWQKAIVSELICKNLNGTNVFPDLTCNWWMPLWWCEAHRMHETERQMEHKIDLTQMWRCKSTQRNGACLWAC